MTVRVLHIGKYFPPDRGGMEAYLADLVLAQRAEGVEAAALVHGEPRRDDAEWLVRVPVRTSVAYAPIAPGFRAALKRMLARFEPTVLHLHMPNNAVFWALTLAEARALPWVVHWHSDVVVAGPANGLALAYRAYRPFEQAVLARAERIIATSGPYLAASEPLMRWREKCTVVPLGLDPARLPQRPDAGAALPWPQDAFRLLSIGRLTYYKGFETLVRAMAAVPNAHLVIAGDGDQRPVLEALIAQTTPPGQAPRVTLAGAVSEAHKCALLAACDAFCLASCERTEAFGVAVLEAMRYAKPCLVSDLPGSGLPWLVQSSGAGQLVPVGDVDAWRRAIDALQCDRPSAVRHGRSGQAALLARFDVRRSVPAIGDVYRASGLDDAAAPKDGPLIVIPARDEARTIGAVIAALHDGGWHDIVVVNDQSRDDTAEVAARAGARVLNPVLPLGAWGAMQTGIRYALRHGYTQVVTIDADGQHEPAYIPALLEAARCSDVVIGAFPARGSAARKLAWRYFRMLTGFGIEDLTSGFRCYNRAACEVLAAEEATLLDYQDLGVLLLLRHAGLDIAEVPVEMYARVTGPSRIFASWSRVARYMVESTLLCLARWHPRHHLRR